MQSFLTEAMIVAKRPFSALGGFHNKLTWVQTMLFKRQTLFICHRDI